MTKKSTSPVLNVRDTSGDLHAAAARISKAMTGNIDYSAGVIHALSFTDTYYKRVSKEIDYATAPIDVLRDYVVHGYDFTVRAPALAEIERRIIRSVLDKMDYLEFSPGKWSSLSEYLNSEATK